MRKFISCFTWINFQIGGSSSVNQPLAAKATFASCFSSWTAAAVRNSSNLKRPRADPVMRSTWTCHRLLWVLMVYIHIQAKKPYSIHILWYNPYLALHSEKKPCTSMHWNMNHQTSVPKFDPGGKRSLQCNQVDCSTCQGRRWKSPYQVDLAELPAGWSIRDVGMEKTSALFSHPKNVMAKHVKM